MFHIDRLYHHSLVNLVQNASFFLSTSHELADLFSTIKITDRLYWWILFGWCLFLVYSIRNSKEKETNNENHDSLWTENHCTMTEKRLPFLTFFRWIKSFLDHKVKSIVSQFSNWIWFSLFWQKRTCKLLFIFIKSELGIWLCSKFLKGRCGVGGGG